MRNADPRVKLALIIYASTLAIIFQDLRYMALLTVVTLLLCYLLGGELFSLINRLKKLIPLLFGIAILQLIFVRTGEPLLQISDHIIFYSDGAYRSANMALRLLIIFASAAVMVGENSRKTIAVLSKMRVPYMFSFMLMLTLRFIPFFAESFSDALISIQLRGIEIERVSLVKKLKIYSHILSPVVADAVVKSQELSVAMQARGFGANRRRTSYINPVLTALDIAIILALSALFVLSLFLYF